MLIPRKEVIKMKQQEARSSRIAAYRAKLREEYKEYQSQEHMSFSDLNDWRERFNRMRVYAKELGLKYDDEIAEVKHELG